MISLDKLTPVQVKALSCPVEYGLGLFGGRGGGKSAALLLIALRHVQEHGCDSKILFLRQNHAALSEMIDEAVILFTTVFGEDVAFNKNAQRFTWRNGATMEMNQLFDLRDYVKYQGRSFSLLLLDEVTLWPTPDLIDKLRSNLRGKIECRVCCSGNPGGPGHSWVNTRWVQPSNRSEAPFDDGVQKMVALHSTYRSNPHINREQYAAQLRASCRGSEALLKSWLDGDWSCVAGMFWSGSFTDANVIKWPHVDVEEWSHVFKNYLAHDHGTRAPFCTYLVCEFLDDGRGPDDEFYRAGSKCFVDEVTNATRDALDVGLSDIPEICVDILQLCNEWNARPRGFADDATFSNCGLGFYHDAYREGGVNFRPARKGLRKDGLFKMRTMFEAVENREDPGLFIDRRCWYAHETLQVLEADERDPENMLKSRIDHACDAIRYGVVAGEPMKFSQTPAPYSADYCPQLNRRRIERQEKIIARCKKRGIKTIDFAAQRGGQLLSTRIQRR